VDAFLRRLVPDELWKLFQRVMPPTPTQPQRGGRRPSGEHGLTRERVVAAAMEIADTEGLGTLSMRAIAARQGVSTMVTYRYVGGKEDLVMFMADAAYGEAVWPETPPDGWRPRVEPAARLLWQVHRRHPWLAHITPLNRPLALPNLMAHSEQLLTALDGLGRDAVRSSTCRSSSTATSRAWRATSNARPMPRPPPGCRTRSGPTPR
jgi:AcrR family transcriptional regulator